MPQLAIPLCAWMRILYARKILLCTESPVKKSERLSRLDGVELASFWRRALAFTVDHGNQDRLNRTSSPGFVARGRAFSR